MGAHGLTPSSTMGAQIACQLGAERGNQRAKKIRKHLTRCGRGVRWGGGWRGLDPEGTGIGGSRELMGSARKARLWPWTLPKVAPAFPISCFPVLVLRSSGAPWALFPISFFRSSFVFLAPHPTQLPESKMGTSKTFVPIRVSKFPLLSTLCVRVVTKEVSLLSTLCFRVTQSVSLALLRTLCVRVSQSVSLLLHRTLCVRVNKSP